MPYKNLKSKRARETAKIRMRRYRERKRSVEEVNNATGNFAFVFSIDKPDGPLPPDEQAQYDNFIAVVKEFMKEFALLSDEDAKGYMELLKQITDDMKARKPKNRFEGVQAFITNLLEMRLDLQGLKHRGGTA